MNPTSTAQTRATEDGTLPPLERIRRGVWVVPLTMPRGQPRLGYTLTYLLIDGEDRVHVVDPGWDSDDNWGALQAALRAVPSSGDVAWVIVTHLHPDHLGMAARLRRETGAALVLHERESEAIERLDAFRPVDPSLWGVPGERRLELSRIADGSEQPMQVVRPDVTVRGDTDHLRPPGLDIEVLHTPGHTTGSICLRLPARRLPLTGDHVLPSVHPGLGLGGTSARNPIAEYLDSLDRVVGYDDHEVLPGHQYRFTGLADRVATTAAHHRRRTDEVEYELQQHPDASVYEIASVVSWTAGWQNMRGFYLYSALAQTAMHIDYLRTMKHHDHPSRSSA